MAANTAQIENLYNTHPLPPEAKTSIRVFVVQPAHPDDEEALIRGDFQVIHLAALSAPQFTALSYVWGDQTGRTVECGGISLLVTQNGLDALLHLRNILGSFTIWLDAICINQSDQEEKTRQLQFMHRIYALAHTTYVWLGTGTEETDRAMNFCSRGGLIDFLDFDAASTPAVPSTRRRYEAVKHYTISHLCKSQMLPIIQQNPTMVRWRLNPKSKTRSEFSSSVDLGSLLSKPWIRRIWTFQEILLASNPIMVCGDKQVSWTRLMATVLFLQQQRYLGLPPTLLQTWERMHGCRIFVQETIDHKNVLTETPLGNDGASLDSMKAILAYQDLVSSTLAGYRHIHKALKWIFNLGFLIALALIGAIVPSIQDQYSKEVVAGICIVYAAGCFIFPFLNWVLDTMDYQRPVKAEDSIPETPQFDLVDGILNRDATDKKDKAFGLRAVVQQMMCDRELPRPDYATPRGDVYKESSTLLIHATGRLGALLPAAVKHFDGQPSWVADWSKDIENIWIADLIGTNVKDNRTLAPDHFHKPSSSVKYEFDRINPNLLRFQGKHVGKVATRSEFKATKPTYDEQEAGIHLHNLTQLIELIGFPYRANDATKNKYYIRHVSDHWRIQLRKLAVSPEPDHDLYRCPVPDRAPFEHLCDTPRKLYKKKVHETNPETVEGPESYFRGENRAINEEELKLQIWLCNGLIKAGQRLARFEWRKELMGEMKMPFYAGFCTAAAQVEDKVIAVPGVSRLLVVRETAEPSSSTIEFVSPAILYQLRVEEMSWSPDEPLDEFRVV